MEADRWNVDGAYFDWKQQTAFRLHHQWIEYEISLLPKKILLAMERRKCIESIFRQACSQENIIILSLYFEFRVTESVWLSLVWWVVNKYSSRVERERERDEEPL